MKINLYSLLIAILLPAGVWAQNTLTVQGRVLDASDTSALPGVNVQVRGATGGTTTDANGAFSIVAGPDDVLHFSYIGYKPQDVPVGGRTRIDVRLENEVTQLSDVVVVGYGNPGTEGCDLVPSPR